MKTPYLNDVIIVIASVEKSLETNGPAGWVHGKLLAVLSLVSGQPPFVIRVHILQVS